MRILVSDDLSAEGVAVLRRLPGTTVDVRTGLKPAELKAIIAEYDGLVVRSATKVTREILEAAVKLKVVGRAGSGVDNIDVPAATERKVLVMNTPGGNTNAVVELTLALMFALLRQVPQASASTRTGRWEKKRFAAGRELRGLTVGVVGAGNIGGRVANLCRALGANVQVHDPLLPADAASRLGIARFVALDELVATSDIVTLHIPLSPETRNLLSAERLARMKKGAWLVNCARGGLVDEAALAAALQEKRLAGAAFDTFEKEPPAADHPLLACESFVCTPHLGASTEEAQAAVALAVAEQMADYLRDGTVRNAVNRLA
jgi:D-3-phosphoglycerate dehydrogenase/(S)-sulfolactate dehydrogenase